MFAKVESSKLCAILPRPQAACFILEIESIRLICFKETCLMLENKSVLQDEFFQHIMASLSGENIRTTELSSFLNFYQTSTENVEFGHKVLESALAVTVAKYDRYIRIIKPAVDLLSAKIAADPQSASLRRMLAIKKSLGVFELSIENVIRVLQGLLSKDEDLIGLYLSKHEREFGQHEEVEVLLESYLADLEDMRTTIRNIKSSIDDTNQYINAHLGTLRNEIISWSLYMEMTGVCLGAGSLASGLMGMNLIHGLEENPYAFYVFTSGMTGCMLLAFGRFLTYYRSLWDDTSSAHSFKVIKNFMMYVETLEEEMSGGKDELSEKEFKDALNRITGDKVPEAEAEFIFRMFDKNKDRKIDTKTELKLSSSGDLKYKRNK